jgi:RND superfamily putative drug exporter
VFASFVFSDDPTIKQFGFALAVGVLIDAFLVRMTLVPAVMSLLGPSAWWLPRWLGPLLPAMDLEGEGERDEQARHTEVAAPEPLARDDREAPAEVR